MAIRVACPHCDSNLNAPDSAGGKTVKCPKCGGLVILPESEVSEPAPVQASAKPKATSPSKSSAANKTRRLPADDDQEDRPKKRPKRNDDYDDEDDRPKRRSKRAVDDYDDEDDRPKRRSKRAVDDYDDEDDRPKRRSKRAVDDYDDDYDDRRRSSKSRKKKKKSGMIIQIVAAIAVLGMAGVFLTGFIIYKKIVGGPEQQTVAKFGLAMENHEFGEVWDMMSSGSQKEFSPVLSLLKLQLQELNDKSERDVFIYMMQKGNQDEEKKQKKGFLINVQKVEIVGDERVVFVKDPDGTISEWPLVMEGNEWKVKFMDLKVDGKYMIRDSMMVIPGL